MRTEGDQLLLHLAQVKDSALLCAPFIKWQVLNRLLDAMPSSVPVQIFTRWLPQEIAAGVSDLEVFDLCRSRENTTLRLLDNLHAKLYIADASALIGSANLTATALGWCRFPNAEILTECSANLSNVEVLLKKLSLSRLATAEEMNSLKKEVDNLTIEPQSESQALDTRYANVWLPTLPDPKKLWRAYNIDERSRLTFAALAAADYDLHALSISSGLDLNSFNTEVAHTLRRMPAVHRILIEVENDLSDETAMQIIKTMHIDDSISFEDRWIILRDWITHFLQTDYETVPQTFVMRLKSGIKRNTQH